MNKKTGLVKKVVYQVESRTSTWLDLRKKCDLCSSDLAAVLDLSTNYRRSELINVKKTKKEREFDPFVRDILKWGVDHEPNAIRAFENYMGLTKDNKMPAMFMEATYKHNTRDIKLGVTPDAVYNTPHGHFTLEAKCPWYHRNDPKAPTPKMEYVCQMLAQMYSTECKKAYLIVWVPLSYNIYYIERSEDTDKLWRWVIKKAIKFTDHCKTPELVSVKHVKFNYSFEKFNNVFKKMCKNKLI